MYCMQGEIVRHKFKITKTVNHPQVFVIVKWQVSVLFVL